MPRLVADPNLEQCPDYSSEVFEPCRAPLLSNDLDDTQAAATLRTFWHATNSALKVQWQLQLESDALEAQKQQCLVDEAAAQDLAAKKLQDSIIAEEDRKKNRIHQIIIPDRPRPKWATDEVLVADFALRKIDKAQFVELYYWTNKGLADARVNYRTSDDDSMVATAGVDGSATWISASAARPAAGVIPDHLLTPLDFSRAIPRFIASLEQRGWPDSRVVMLANFFGALMLHKYWTSEDALETRALLTYQEEQRRAWHQAIPQPAGAWNISILDNSELSSVYDQLYHAERVRVNQEFDLKVRSFLSQIIVVLMFFV
ncbi:uncharacterized protein F5891DRAFT_988454 [Suillus fuscotomentosus]|uniref:Uncharacterized protein n=1 Tax=Suillus fuscotomentosus TaxID=1912939 RepID=A0AAD4HC79_9AGAM|nr:uncharacterized protein F5891DRAFT_988454 [Suillus fuscotomentosus]KAG1887409.1 hypothetical protein F5891DRAFT_988454 [Suillus fuscotomentosus]